MIIITIGAPCTGKTTWSKKLCDSRQNIVRVCRGDICEMLKNSRNVPVETALHVQRMYEIGIVSAIDSGYDVIADARHLEYSELMYYYDIFGGKTDIYLKIFDEPFHVILSRLIKLHNAGARLVNKAQVTTAIEKAQELTQKLNKDIAPFKKYEGFYDPDVI